MHYGHLESSLRLQRTLQALSDGNWHSTRDIMDATDSCAVHSDMAALKRNGVAYETRRQAGHQRGPRVFLYRLAPKEAAPCGA